MAESYGHITLSEGENGQSKIEGDIFATCKSMLCLRCGLNIAKEWGIILESQAFAKQGRKQSLDKPSNHFVDFQVY
jgi:hypothetical protein